METTLCWPFGSIFCLCRNVPLFDLSAKGVPPFSTWPATTSALLPWILAQRKLNFETFQETSTRMSPVAAPHHPFVHLSLLQMSQSSKSVPSFWPPNFPLSLFQQPYPENNNKILTHTFMEKQTESSPKNRAPSPLPIFKKLKLMTSAPSLLPSQLQQQKHQQQQQQQLQCSELEIK